MKALTIAGRELRGAFFSPMAYLVITVFLVLAGYFFSAYAARYEVASLRMPLGNIAICLLFIVPLITMRTFAEENHTGTIEVLLTDPVRDRDIVIGKFLGACGFFMLMLAPTFLYVIILERLGTPDRGPILAGYAGLILMGMMMIALGVTASAMTRNQIVAGMLSFAVLLVLWLVDRLAESLDPTVGRVLNFVGLFEHYNAFRRGIIDTRSVVYYISSTVLLLFFATRIVETRRWR